MFKSFNRGFQLVNSAPKVRHLPGASNALWVSVVLLHLFVGRNFIYNLMNIFYVTSSTHTSMHPYIRASVRPYIHTSIHPYTNPSIRPHMHTYIYTVLQICSSCFQKYATDTETPCFALCLVCESIGHTCWIAV